MIRIATKKCWAKENEKNFMIVDISSVNKKNLDIYLELINCDPFEGWVSHGQIWNGTWQTEAQCGPDWSLEVPWNKKYENIIHEYNNLFYSDQLCESDDKNTM